MRWGRGQGQGQGQDQGSYRYQSDVHPYAISVSLREAMNERSSGSGFRNDGVGVDISISWITMDSGFSRSQRSKTVSLVFLPNLVPKETLGPILA
ncbi:hypothetical protein SAY86_029921 [Trapa natans]|uniref:Uncharacterized protein n=1 Tax=Trapa natans TaxID=22666 RepID=A0AAN7M222_TRANT|nr:hypothetical protein SAY86_029921 [Trapa natans]